MVWGDQSELSKYKMYDAITHKLQMQISWGWSRIEEKKNCRTFAYIKRNGPIMLRKQPSKLYFSLSRFGKVVQFCAEFSSNHFISRRNILGKKLRFLWFSFQDYNKTRQFSTKKRILAVTNQQRNLKHQGHWVNGTKSIVEVALTLASIPDLGKKHLHPLLATCAQN